MMPPLDAQPWCHHVFAKRPHCRAPAVHHLAWRCAATWPRTLLGRVSYTAPNSPYYNNPPLQCNCNQQCSFIEETYFHNLHCNMAGPEFLLLRRVTSAWIKLAFGLKEEKAIK